MKQINQKYPLTSKREIKDLLKAWVAISLAFGIILSRNPEFGFTVLAGIAAASITVGIGFLFHELAHRLVARKYKCFAEFRSFDTMLFLAVFMAWALGFVFAAPGAVMIHGYNITKKKNGIISLAGPLTNLLIALVFLGLMIFVPNIALKNIFQIGFIVNIFLGIFNMIPFANFDGKKILAWSKPVYWFVILAGLILFFIQPIIV